MIVKCLKIVNYWEQPCIKTCISATDLVEHFVAQKYKNLQKQTKKITKRKCFAFILGSYQVAIGWLSIQEIVVQYGPIRVPKTYLCEKAKE